MRSRRLYQHKPTNIWHAYVVRGFGEFAYNVHSMVDSEASALLRRYLHAAFDGNMGSWDIMKVLDLMRDERRGAVRNLARSTFPSIFDKKRPKYPLKKPTEFEVTDEQLELARNFRNEWREIRANRKPQGEEMSATGNTELAGVMVTLTRTNEDKTVVPIQVDAGELTLDNFQEKTGKRFRMTKDQVQRFFGGSKVMDVAPDLAEEGRQKAFAEVLDKLVTTARQNQTQGV